MPLVQVSDFKGVFTLRKDEHSQSIYLGYITTNENKLIREIFGIDLGGQIITYIANNQSPVNPEFQFILNEFSYQYGRRILYSAGLKNILCGLIYHEIVTTDNRNPSVNGGLERARTENATPVRANYSNYLNSVDWIECVQKYVQSKPGDYTGYAGTQFLRTWMI